MILIFNAGSSSLKAKLYSISEGFLSLIKEESVSSIKGAGGLGHKKATKEILNKLNQHHKDIFFVGHRIVMGGEKARDGEAADKKAVDRLNYYRQLAPMHNPAAIAVIQTTKKYLSKAKNHLFYDTTYYQSMPQSEKIYPIDQKIAQRFGVIKYGYHGISHRYAYEVSGASKYQKILSIHLGAGCSITAIYQGKPIATSMGMTPAGGLIMQTRCGDIDPGVVSFLSKKLGIAKTEKLLENQSGLKALSGGSGEMLEILHCSGDKVEDESFSKLEKYTKIDKIEAKLALEKYCIRIRDYIGAYSLRMDGVDAIIFTGKIGAGSSVIRDKILYGLDFLLIKEIFCVSPDEETAIAKMMIELVINT